MSKRVEVGTWGPSFPPFELAVQSAVEAEKAGWDIISWWDQANGWFPRAIHTPDVTPVASLMPDVDAFFDPGPVIAQAAAVTENIRFLYGIIDSVRRSPFVIAQTILTLDNATKGRTVTILASGEVKQMRPYGFSRKGSADKLWDTVHIVKKFCTTNDPISYEGRVWKLDRALLSLPSYGDTAPPVWVAGGSDEDLYLAATVADGWLTYAPGATEDDPELFREQVAKLRKFAEEAGRNPDDIAVALCPLITVHQDEKVVDQLRDHPHVRWLTMMCVPNSDIYKKWGLTHPMGDDWGYARKLIPSWLSRDEAFDIINRTPREAVDRVSFAGTPEYVADRLAPYVDAGMTHLFLFNCAPAAGVEDHSALVRDAIGARSQ